jgi:hypothetical protein
MLANWEQERLAEIEAGLRVDHPDLFDDHRRRTRRRLAAGAAALWAGFVVVCVIWRAWDGTFALAWLAAMVGGAWLVTRWPPAAGPGHRPHVGLVTPDDSPGDRAVDL